jgi:hypothetical protein
MREYFVFDDPDIRAILKGYVVGQGGIVEDMGNFLIRKVGRIKRLEYAVQEFVDWWDEETDVERLRSLLRKRYYRVVFKNLLEFSQFRRVIEGAGLKWKVSWSRVYYVPLGKYGSWDEVRKSFSKNVWKNVRNSRNRIKRFYGDVKILEGKPMEVYAWTVDRIKGKHPESLFHSSGYVKVLQDVLSVLHRRGMLKVWILKGGNEILATNYVIESGDVALSYLAGYDRRGDFYRVLLYEVIGLYQSRGFREFNFMKGESPYKRQWTDSFYKLYRYEAINPHPLRRFLSLF